jgi:hypothetical protein
LPGVIHSHEVFHVAALVGALCHWMFLWRVATGELPLPRERPPLLADETATAVASAGRSSAGDAEIAELRRRALELTDRAAELTAEARKIAERIQRIEENGPK